MVKGQARFTGEARALTVGVIPSLPHYHLHVCPGLPVTPLRAYSQPWRALARVPAFPSATTHNVHSMPATAADAALQGPTLASSSPLQMPIPPGLSSVSCLPSYVLSALMHFRWCTFQPHYVYDQHLAPALTRPVQCLRCLLQPTWVTSAVKSISELCCLSAAHAASV